MLAAMEPTAAPEATAAERIAAEHKLDVDHSKPQKGKGKLGSLENPEVYENVPGHLIPIIEREFDDFDTEAGRFLARRAARGAVHRLPAQAGRLRPAPARRADDPREAADGRRHARSRWTPSPT